MKPVAICKNLLSVHRTSDTKIKTWEDVLREKNIPYEYVDCYAYDIVDKLDNYSALLWHYSNFVVADLLEAQNILTIAEQKGLKVFPNFHTGWHFDDKVAEMYAFQAVKAPIPDSWVFYRLEDCVAWLKNEAHFPIVAKLRNGSGSNNVKMIKSKSQGIRYAKRMFTRGYQPAPSLMYKTFSKIQSTHDWKTFVERFKKIPNFLWARRFAKQMPVEKGYCYFQDFTPNDGFDIKVAVVGDKCGFFFRHNRKGDFRASGGGDFYYDDLPRNVIDSAFATADALKMQCVGFDYVVDNRTGEGKIIEMCFGFDQDAVYEAGGWYDREGVWHKEPLNVVEETVLNLLKELGVESDANQQ